MKQLTQVVDKDFDWEITVFDSPERNAFCLPGGKMGIYTGMLEITDTNEATAAVLGQEIAHATTRHGAERLSQGLVAQGLMTLTHLSLEDSKYRGLIMGALFIVSRYLAMFQLGYIDYVWDPFFGFESGSKRVLNSKMSHMWPISDGGLGTISYTFEFLMGYMGIPSRWRTMPWMVAFFGVLVIPLGLTHIFLVISQPVIVHAWCTMCLLAALIMLPMIPLEVDEVVAMFQHMRHAKDRGDRGGSWWRIFWLGGKADSCREDHRSPPLVDMPQRPMEILRASIWGMCFPKTLVASTACGALLMFCPTWFDLDIKMAAADAAHLGGALIVTVSVISMGEVIRVGRYLNVLLAGAVASVVWFLPASLAFAAAVSVLGITAAGLSLPRGVIRESYGKWDKWVR